MIYYDLFDYLYLIWTDKTKINDNLLYENVINGYYSKKFKNENILKIYKIKKQILNKKNLVNITNIYDGNDVYQYNEIIKQNQLIKLNEYQYINNYISEFPDIKTFKKIDHIYIPKLEDNINVGIIETNISYSVLAEYNNEIIAVLDFQKLSNNKYVIFRKTICKLLRKGITYNLLLWFKRKYNVGIFSDSQMTKEGESFWNYIINNNKDKFKIVDLKYSETYDLNMIGKKSKHNEMIKHPKDDNETDDFINFGKGNQQWIWLFEENEPNINNKFGIPMYLIENQIFYNNTGYYHDY